MSQAAGGRAGRPQELGDFTASLRLVFISGLAAVIGVLCAFVALALLRLIGLFTNLFFFGRFGTDLVSPRGNHLGLFLLLVPVAGGLVIGLMAKLGSERIRGHGIPEAIEAILISGSKIEPKVAILKPLSAALSIGTGGPFGAEGPIIMTGGAVGSMIAQLIHLTSAERKTLLVAGAAGGMSATFSTPLAAVMLAVELLLFEWKPRSLVPVGVASGVAAVARYYIIGAGPLFPVPAHAAFVGPDGLLACVLVGVIAAVMAVALTAAVYASEDAFRLLPVHWMWWPAIGGLIIGIGGFIYPGALGVGYDVIRGLLQGDTATTVILGVLLVKSVIWAGSLGSGTSGGVLAPLLMMGGALGAMEAGFLPNEGVGFWPMISMGAILAGTMRSPLTGVVFTIELTHDVNALLPLLVAAMAAHGLSVLSMKRSILTEKVARRGYHVSREYSVDPLEILFVREVMRTNVLVLRGKMRAKELGLRLEEQGPQRGQRLYPVADEKGELVGVIPRNELTQLGGLSRDGDGPRLSEVAARDAVVAYPDEPLRVVVYRMAETGLTRFPVIERGSRRVLGMVSLYDLLKARTKNMEAERRREQVLRLPVFFGRRRAVLDAEEAVEVAVAQRQRAAAARVDGQRIGNG